MSKIADEDMTIVIKELKGVKLATILAHRVGKALNIEKKWRKESSYAGIFEPLSRIYESC